MTERASDYSYSSVILANEVNITTEGLRYYEKKGIGQYIRKENGYRAYHPQEASVLRLIRTLNSFGFSIKESIDMITGDISCRDLFDKLQKKRTELQENIRRSQLILSRLEQHLDAVGHLSDAGSQVWFEQHPAFYYLNYGNGIDIYKNKELNALVHRWMDQIPVVLPVPRLAFSDFTEYEDPVITGGFIIQESDLMDSSLLNDHYCCTYPARNYLCTISRQTNMDGLTIHEPGLQNTFNLMKNMNLRLDGDCFFQSILASEKEYQLAVDYKVYLPVSPIL